MLVTISCERCGKKYLEVGRTSWHCIVHPPGIVRRLLGMGPRMEPIPVPTGHGVLEKMLPRELRGLSMVDLLRMGHVKSKGRCWCVRCSKGFEAVLDDLHDDAPRCTSCGEPGKIIGDLVDKSCPACKQGVVRRSVVAIL